MRVKLRNLISLYPKDKHIIFYSNNVSKTDYWLDSDYNLFWPINESEDQFHFRAQGIGYYGNFSGWKELSSLHPGSTFDPNSMTVDPMFISADPQVPEDFKLLLGSPAIDAGVDVGLRPVGVFFHHLAQEGGGRPQ